MTRVLLWIVALLLNAGGAIGVSAYLIALAVSSDREAITTGYGSVFAFSAVALVAGIVTLLALVKKLPARLPFPNQWVSLSILLISATLGIVFSQADILPVIAPFLALIATAALFAFFARFLTRWSPSVEHGPRGFILPSLWGGIGAPFLAGSFQLLTVVALVVAGGIGLYAADETLLDNLEPWLNEQVDPVSSGSDADAMELLKKPAVALGAVSLLGITAPLTEELTKFLGVYLLFRNRFVTRNNLFIAGVASGLGFAVVETLGYALMSGDSWSMILLVRAPVAVIHMVCTAIVAVGWYQQRKRGGIALAGFFLVSVLVHAAWNTLFVSLMLVALGTDTTDAIDPAAGATMLALVTAMGVVFLGSLFWLVGNARRFGRQARAEVPVGAPAGHTVQI